MKVERLFKIMNMLLANRVVSATTLAKLCNVSTRTIYRDVDTLVLAKIPIHTLQGKNGGFSIDENYVISKGFFDKSKQDNILSIIQLLQDTPIGENDAFLNLFHTFNTNQNTWLDIDTSKWSYNQKEQSLLLNLRQAILQKVVVSIEYINNHGDIVIDDVEPMEVLYRESCWYLVAYCKQREDIKAYIIRRMVALVITNIEIKNHGTKTSEVIVSNNDVWIMNIKMIVPKSALTKVTEMFMIDAIEKREDTYIVYTTYPMSDNVPEMIASLGEEITVLLPEPLALKVENKRKELIY